VQHHLHCTQLSLCVLPLLSNDFAPCSDARASAICAISTAMLRRAELFARWKRYAACSNIAAAAAASADAPEVAASARSLPVVPEH
jgi:hypothetical protein